jgi:hypothetical protein
VLSVLSGDCKGQQLTVVILRNGREERMMRYAQLVLNLVVKFGLRLEERLWNGRILVWWKRMCSVKTGCGKDPRC